MRKLILFAISVLGLFSVAQSQTYRLSFTYDTAGNQTTRTYTTTASKKINNDTTESLVDQEQNIQSSLENQITIYPNPTDGILKVEWLPELTEDIKSIQVIELSGRSWEIAKNQIDSHSVDIDLTQNASGTYIIQFKFLKQPTITKKIIKK